VTAPVPLKPTDWQDFSLGDLLKFSNGINADKSAYGSGVPFANVLEVINNESLREQDIPGRVNLPSKVLARYQVRRGDLLFNRTSETQEEVGLASVYLGNQPIVFGGFVFRGHPLTKYLDINFSKYALRSASVRDQITARGQGGIRANIGQRDLKTVMLSLPPIPEQRVIAEFLDDVSRQIGALEHLVVKKQAVNQGIMQQLLTGKTRLPGFATSWRDTHLGDVLTVRHGKNQKAVEHPTGKYPILASGGQIGWASMPLYSKPSVLIGRKGTIDRPQYQATPFWTVDTLFYTEITAQADPRYLYYMFLTIDWRSMNEASGVPSLNSRSIEGVKVQLPAVDEQRAIRLVLDDSNCEIDSRRARLGKTQAVKQGMMQELLTGRIRLPVPESLT
jgi:type I restriction enzyme S subunit